MSAPDAAVAGPKTVYLIRHGQAEHNILSVLHTRLHTAYTWTCSTAAARLKAPGAPEAWLGLFPFARVISISMGV